MLEALRRLEEEGGGGGEEMEGDGESLVDRMAGLDLGMSRL